MSWYPPSGIGPGAVVACRITGDVAGAGTEVSASAGPAPVTGLTDSATTGAIRGLPLAPGGGVSGSGFTVPTTSAPLWSTGWARPVPSTCRRERKASACKGCGAGPPQPADIDVSTATTAAALTADSHRRTAPLDCDITLLLSRRYRRCPRATTGEPSSLSLLV